MKRLPSSHSLASKLLMGGISGLAVLLTLANPGSAQVVTDVYSFKQAQVAQGPQFVTPTQGRNGQLYVTTFGGYPAVSVGSIFGVSSSGSAHKIYSFDTTTGSDPDAGVTLASDGNFYGTTPSGGSANFGVLFKVTPAGAYTVLHEFTGGTDGADPEAPPMEGSDGSLYGATFANSAGFSTVYKYTPAGVFSTIYQFDQAHGNLIVMPLIEAADGNLYGTAPQGGVNNCGTIFQLARSGEIGRTYSFRCDRGGASPLVQATDGNFYGTTSTGGRAGFGTVFKMDQKGFVSILYSFTGQPTDGNAPAGLVEATDGNLYGATEGGGTNNDGTLFQIMTSGTYKLLFSFPLHTGESPRAALLQHTNGLLYGTTSSGGLYGTGAVYSLDMGLGPFITFVLATSHVAQTAQILGQGLTGTTGVTFNGVAATSFKVVSDTFLIAVVPSGATTGPVVVTTPSGTLTSNKSFTIVPGP
jgi:uncharacterized repeat protein (TIGR03803 family)